MSKVKCTNCNKIFNENELIYDGEEDMDFCPFCGEGNCFEDVEKKKIDREKMESEIRTLLPYLLQSSISDDYVWYIITDEFVESVLKDVEECSSFQDEGYYNEADIKLAIGRTLLNKLGIAFD